MLVFWSLAALLIAVTLALLLRPLLRARHVAVAPDADAAAISVYRDQKQALDAECTDGVITPAERDAAVTELARRLGDEVATVRSAETDQRGQRRAWLAAAARMCPERVISSDTFLKRCSKLRLGSRWEA